MFWPAKALDVRPRRPQLTVMTSVRPSSRSVVHIWAPRLPGCLRVATQAGTGDVIDIGSWPASVLTPGPAMVRAINRFPLLFLALGRWPTTPAALARALLRPPSFIDLASVRNEPRAFN